MPLLPPPANTSHEGIVSRTATLHVTIVLSATWHFNITATHPQRHSNICDCCSLRWIQRRLRTKICSRVLLISWTRSKFLVAGMLCLLQVPYQTHRVRHNRALPSIRLRSLPCTLFSPLIAGRMAELLGPTCDRPPLSSATLWTMQISARCLQSRVSVGVVAFLRCAWF